MSAFFSVQNMTHLVIQAPDLSSEAVEHLSRLAKAKKTMELAPGAVRLVEADGAPAVRAEVAAYCQQAGVDWAYVAPGARLADWKILAMDMDSTLINIECIDEIADMAGLKPQVAAITEAAMRGEIADFSESLTRRVALLQGLPLEALERVYAERLRLNPGAERLLEVARGLGLKTLLVSGGFTWFTGRLKHRLQLDEAHANELEVVDGRLTGKVVGAILDADGKPYVLEQVVDYQTGYDIGFDDNFHYSRILPSKLSPEDQAALRHCAAVGIQTLGMKNSPAHVEIIMTKDGPRIVEIGARNGGYRERMHRLANGIDITGNALKLVLGQTPEITARRNEPVAVLELFPKTPGNFAGIAHEEELRQLPSLTYLSIKKKPGEYVGKSSDGFTMCAVVILHHADSEQFHRDLTFVNEHVRVVTE